MPKPYDLRQFRPSWAGEPTLASLEGTISELANYRPDWIVAAGGGRILDGARLCWALYEHPGFHVDRLGIPFALPPLRGVARFVAIPTTAGTGAECSSASIFTDTQTGRKVPVVTHDFLPDIVVLEPRLTAGLSMQWTVLPALDALAHALEGRVSLLLNPLVDDSAESSAVSILNALFELQRSGDPSTLRKRLQIAAYYAGQVQNLRLVGLAHAVAHQLGRWPIPHAAAVGMLLPLSLRTASRVDSVRQIYDDIARRCGLSGLDMMIDSISGMMSQVGLPSRLGAWPGLPAEMSSTQAMEVATAALVDPIARYLPFKIGLEELALRVQEAW